MRAAKNYGLGEGRQLFRLNSIIEREKGTARNGQKMSKALPTVWSGALGLASETHLAQMTRRKKAHVGLVSNLGLDHRRKGAQGKGST